MHSLNVERQQPPQAGVTSTGAFDNRGTQVRSFISPAGPDRTFERS